MDSHARLSRLGLDYAILFGSIALIYPFLPIYLDYRYLSPSRIGLLLGMMELSGLAAPIVLSRLADRSGRYKSVMALLVGASTLSFYFLDSFSTFPAILAAALFFGFFFKPLIPMTDALSGRVLADSSANYGKVRVWGTVSFIVVSLVLQATGIMDAGVSRVFFLAFMVAFFAQFIGVLIVPSAPSHKETEPVSGEGGLRSLPPGFFSFLAVGFIGNLGFSVYQAFSPLYFADIVGVSGVSGLFALSAVVEIPVLIFGGRLLRKFGHRWMLGIAQAACLVRLLILAFFPSPLPVIASQLTHAFVYGFYLLSGVDWVNRIVPVRNRALGMGVFMAVSFSGTQLLGSTIGGFILEHRGFQALFALGALFPVLGMIWLLSDRRIGSEIHLDSTS